MFWMRNALGDSQIAWSSGRNETSKELMSDKVSMAVVLGTFLDEQSSHHDHFPISPSRSGYIGLMINHLVHPTVAPKRLTSLMSLMLFLFSCRTGTGSMMLLASRQAEHGQHLQSHAMPTAA